MSLHRLSFALTGAGVLFIALPLVGLLWRVVGYRAWQSAPQSEVLQAVWLSLLTSFLALLLIVLVGTPLGYTLARRSFWGRRLVNTLVELPIVLPPAVAGLALLLTFGRRGLLGETLDALGISLVFTTAGVVVAQTFVAMPFYVRAAQVGFAGVDRDLEAAARVDGAAGHKVFMLITLPLASRALLSGMLLSWARALGEFGATIIFAGSLAGKTRTMPLLVYNILERDLHAALWTALLLVGLAGLAVALTRLLAREESPTN